MARLTKTKYRVLRSFLDDNSRRLIYEYSVLKRNTAQMRPPDERIPTAPRLYADPLTEVLLAQSLEKVEGALGHRLYPTYSYLRVHPHGAAMARHRDRNASEVAVSINIGGDTDWPIWIRPGETNLAIDLAPGDALLYFGREVLHWRQPFTGTVQVQAMLFYVLQEGPFAQYAYDRRAGLGLPSVPLGTPAHRPFGVGRSPSRKRKVGRNSRMAAGIFRTT